MREDVRGTDLHRPYELNAPWKAPWAWSSQHRSGGADGDTGGAQRGLAVAALLPASESVLPADSLRTPRLPGALGMPV